MDKGGGPIYTQQASCCVLLTRLVPQVESTKWALETCNGIPENANNGKTDRTATEMHARVKELATHAATAHTLLLRQMEQSEEALIGIFTQNRPADSAAESHADIRTRSLKHLRTVTDAVKAAAERQLDVCQRVSKFQQAAAMPMVR